jgi:hypothetical protein
MRLLLSDSVSSARDANLSLPPCRDWGEAPDVSGFVGRDQELQTLGRWIATERCRLVFVPDIAARSAASRCVPTGISLPAAASTAQRGCWRPPLGEPWRQGHTATVLGVVLSSSGHLLVRAGHDGTLRCGIRAAVALSRR